MNFNDTLGFTEDLTERKKKEKSLKGAAHIIKNNHTAPIAKYQLWQALMKSRVWYQLTLLAHVDSKARQYAIDYIYRSSKILLGLRGSVSKPKLFRLCFGSTGEEYITNQTKCTIAKKGRNIYDTAERDEYF